jgi:hypothetical protein
VPGAPFDYALVRVVPRVERGERINAGVLVFCPTRGFLGCRVQLDRDRLRALDPLADVDRIERHLHAFAAVCRGDEAAGPIAALPAGERFHWLVGPRSAVIQVSEVHAGATDDPAAALDRLFEALVSPPRR